MPKAEIHPTWYPDAKVYCNGELVMTVGSTQPEISVEVWSGNHPFYTGTQKIMDTEGALIASCGNIKSWIKRLKRLLKVKSVKTLNFILPSKFLLGFFLIGI